MNCLLILPCLAALAITANVIIGNALPRTIKQLTWENCANGPTILTPQELSIQEDVISIPGSFHLTMKYSTSKIIDGNNLRSQVKLSKMIVGLNVAIPCINNVGSCTYEDSCALMQQYWDANSQTCPVFLPVDCTCPIPKTTMGGVTDQLITIDTDTVGNLLLWLAQGDYNLEVNASLGSKALACVKINFKLG